MLRSLFFGATFLLINGGSIISTSEHPAERSERWSIGTGLNWLWRFGVIPIVLVWGLGFLQLGPELPEHQRIALSILVIAGWLWTTEAVPLFVTSLLVLFLCLIWLEPAMNGLSNVEATPSDFLHPFFSDITLLFLGGFVLSSAIRKLGFDEVLGRWLISRIGSSPGRLMLGLMLLTAGLSMWISNTATTAMMLSITLPICECFDHESRWRKALLLSIPFSANIGGIGTPIGSPPNAIAMRYMREIGGDVSFLKWLLIGVPGVLVMLVVTWALLFLIYGRCKGLVQLRPNLVSGRDSFGFGGRHWYTLGVAAVTVLGWLTAELHGVTPGVIALIPVIALFGVKILDASDFRSLPWEVLVLLGGGLCLGVAISHSGLARTIVELLPVTTSTDAFRVAIAFGVIACLLSSFMSNTAAANLLMPIILGMTIDSPGILLVGVAFACSLAMPLPISTPPNAMAFGAGQLRVRDLMIPGTLITGIGLVLAYTTGYWWWDFVGIQ